MRRCDWCGELVEPALLICPVCRSPVVKTTTPLIRRGVVRTVVTVLVLLLLGLLLVLSRV